MPTRATPAAVRKALPKASTSPTVASRLVCTVCRIWMPATAPNWDTICWAAPMTPRSRSSTALAMLEAIAGSVAPAPMPDKARDITINRSVVLGDTRDIPIIDDAMARVPNVAALRSPVRTVR